MAAPSARKTLCPGRALVLSGIYLSYSTDALGCAPAQRLPGDLTGRISARLHATCRADAAARRPRWPCTSTTLAPTSPR
ncbi:hypothetical protein B0I32_1592 [Nonomuraea fuscirosea]|uniref:Uncharacterized protein n=1 Tax=Nonomuraea fuscirosea TaxID=1291556 RepID=A0A2T0LK34_9ACTN|nr:hypothetical protein [Nonomuraea fuscirosea]PRX43156.1 hypothetical protein B0I32_1592 [Nonomuraea fuscirosea]